MSRSLKRVKRSVIESIIDKIEHTIDRPPVEYTPVSNERAKKLRKQRDKDKK